MAAKHLNVAILDDHPSIIDGYRYRLSFDPDIEVVAGIRFGEDLEPLLATHPVDVLLLDVSVPTSPENRSPYPILYLIPALLERYPRLSTLVISMHAQRTLVHAVLSAGAAGYILKDDALLLTELAAGVRQVAAGDLLVSACLIDELQRRNDPLAAGELTERQLETLSLCAAYPAATTAELAQQMHVEQSTFRNLLSGAYLHLKVHSRSAAILQAQHLGYLTGDDPAAAPYIASLESSPE